MGKLKYVTCKKGAEFWEDQGQRLKNGAPLQLPRRP
jgi:hypothetical protein